MPSENSRAYTIIAWVGIAVLALSIPVLALIGQWIGALVMLPFLVVAVMFVRYEPRLPSLFDALFAWAAVINAAGYAWDLYDRINLYDEFVHGTTTFAVTLTFGWLAYNRVRDTLKREPLLFFVAVASFGIAAGTFWELFEWTFGFVGPIPDTMVDLLLDSLGAFAAAYLAVHAREFVAPERA